ncbi:hypothetical protein AYO38_02800 [bacterium SCGC AG-212-C10]|nr:hypothetical protein AYO38_02800 [bacterium SCGC AG-212-C10]
MGRQPLGILLGEQRFTVYRAESRIVKLIRVEILVRSIPPYEATAAFFGGGAAAAECDSCREKTKPFP